MSKETLSQLVKTLLKDNPIPAHDFDHFIRVATLAKILARAEGIDELEAEAAGLLHDLGRLQMSRGHSEESARIAKTLLAESDFDEEARQRIIEAIRQHEQRTSHGKLANVLQDADKLDGLGAIGLVRAVESQPKGVPSDPDEIVLRRNIKTPSSISEQISYQLEWEQMLYTETAKQLARARCELMRNFLLCLREEILFVRG